MGGSAADFRDKASNHTTPVQEGQVAATEAEAIQALSEANGAPSPTSSQVFRLLDFSITDGHGDLCPTERLNFAEDRSFLLSGTIFAAEGKLTRANGQTVKSFGPVLRNTVDYSRPEAQVHLHTEQAVYTCVRPSIAYKQLYSRFAESVDICNEVFKALHPSHQGSPQASLDEIVARLIRCKAGKSYSTPREALLLNGKFVIAQLSNIDAISASSKIRLAQTPFVASMREEMEMLPVLRAAAGPPGALRIGDQPAQKSQQEAAGPVAGGSQPSSQQQRQEEADADLANQIQAQLNAKEARGGQQSRGKGTPYILVSPEEIADDYPEPTEFFKEHDETDELLLMDEEVLLMDPEHLPRQLLSDFAVYNSEGLLSSLELLPMWSDGPASGEAGGSGSGPAGPSGSGQGGSDLRLYLSQIREWVCEFTCDMLFISIRTDAAWYRLARPTDAYAPWFNIVLKCARLAVAVLGMLTAESRPSRLSFNNITKRLAAATPEESTFISPKVDLVERFVVVHGQILMSLIKLYPIKAIQNCAFASSLKQKMQTRRHAKLYVLPKRQLLKAVNRNPMRDRATAKAKPMTATATNMVKAVWASYFKTAEQSGGEAGAEGGQPEVKAVQEDENEEDEEGNAEGSSEQPEDTQPCGPLGLVQALWQNPNGSKTVQVRTILHGHETVLGDAASLTELFLTTEVLNEYVPRP
ncbi:hypothetical protein WJX84_009779 [Apatococcus fuscideae]|uniref:RFTS domain-containing protein n=1 Tax=Apatococcus fuscideae TaxID=2026836 RepID=A0AAW1RZX1_9CHLO